MNNDLDTTTANTSSADAAGQGSPSDSDAARRPPVEVHGSTVPATSPAAGLNIILIGRSNLSRFIARRTWLKRNR